ncbi:MAG: hypothetical protein KDI50_03455 [Candidatus Competibacteraceae bacterium]|nr:hypothetical protein [Candidatus Competibacteraceae bacterium]
MPKKKEPTGTPVKARTTKKVTPAAPVKSEEAAKSTVAETAAKPAAKAVPAANSVKAVEKPAAAAATPVKAAGKSAAATTRAEKSTPSTKSKTAKAAVETKVPASGKRADAVVTVIVAKYDAGFGNDLYVRGEGAGLSWESGVLMKNVENDVWVWTTNEMTEGVISFKFLLNDNTDNWSAGDNLSASSGETTTITPSF